MDNLKKTLGDMVNIPQFIVWKLTKNPEHVVLTKYNKIPVNVKNPQFAADGSNPENWLSYDVAKQAVITLNGHNDLPDVVYTIGFYFTPNCGYWFLDVDNATIDGEWTEAARDIYARLYGCAFEWSSSGVGCHFFGRGEIRTDRQIKPPGTGLELYTEGRGVAFGLLNEGYEGCADLDKSDVINNEIVPLYFPQKVTSNVTDVSNCNFSEPREDYYCTLNDEELLQLMMRSESVGAKFDITKPVFADFYNGNLEILSNYYKGDESLYDAGFASHLAFWTGCHAPRMKEFMLASKLVRDKWDSHKSYLDRTILNACMEQTNVYQARKVAEFKDVMVAEEIDSGDKTILDRADQLELFKDCVYITDVHEIYVPLASGKFRTLKEAQFNAIHGRYTFKLDTRNESSSFTKKAFDAFLKSRLCSFPQVVSARFDPTKRPRTIYSHGGDLYLNSYAPTPIDTRPGDASRFIELITKNFPNGDDAEILLCWMAACVQNPGKKFLWAPILQGAQGCGKTMITDALRYSIGEQFTTAPQAAELGSKFNAWIEKALIVVMNEMRQSKEFEDELKKLLTEDHLNIQAKGKDQYLGRNYANFIFTLNDKSHFKKRKGDRRFFMLYSAMKTVDHLNNAGMTSDYFYRLNKWLRSDGGFAIVADFLTNYEINPKYDPSGSCVRAPDSSCEDEIHDDARNYIETDIMDAISEERYGFKGGFISVTQLMKMFHDVKNRRSFSKYLELLGYAPHPVTLRSDGRLSRVLIEESPNKIRVFCSQKLIDETKNISIAELTDLYQKLQNQ